MGSEGAEMAHFDEHKAETPPALERAVRRKNQPEPSAEAARWRELPERSEAREASDD
jgi:hypothetical protein